MYLGGWSRLGIVLSVLYAIVVGAIAYQTSPTLEGQYSDWIYDASDVIAKKVSAAGKSQLNSYDIRSSLRKDGDEKAIELLKKMAAEPNDKQQLFANELKEVNARYTALVSDLPRMRGTHWLMAIAWWFGGSATLFLFGWIVGWVIRGFRNP